MAVPAGILVAVARDPKVLVQACVPVDLHLVLVTQVEGSGHSQMGSVLQLAVLVGGQGEVVAVKSGWIPGGNVIGIVQALQGHCK